VKNNSRLRAALDYCTLISSNRSDREKNLCWVYFIKAEVLGVVKIGMTSSLCKRLEVLYYQIPDEIIFLGALRCNHRENALEIEKSFHEKYSKKKIKGVKSEWFRLSDSEIQSIIFSHNLCALKIWEGHKMKSIWGESKEKKCEIPGCRRVWARISSIA
jgi:hypothetical protein